ncbi:MAG: hypothetical protein IRZ08_21745, partial [Frankia sp.]|nr:hypothetical protein [Frankia sp.]
APASPRRVHIDWDGSASSALDPEDSVGWRGDTDRDLARLLDELPPHHLDR